MVLNLSKNHDTTENSKSNLTENANGSEWTKRRQTPNQKLTKNQVAKIQLKIDLISNKGRPNFGPNLAQTDHIV